MKKIVLTGAAGRLGSYLREPLTKLADTLVSTDIVDDIGSVYPGESYIQANLESLEEITKVLEDADMVVHFGAYGDEAPFEQLLGPNFVGAYNIWEAAYQNGVRRVVYASSVHAVGMHSRTAGINLDAPHKPDTFYGLAKCFTEDLASMYWDKRGIESVCMRIFSCAQVNNARALGTWLSYDDLIHLVEQSVNTPTTGFTVVYGISNNDRCPVDNSKADFLGYRPKDNAEQFAAKILANAEPEDINDPGNKYLGGPFASVALGNSGVASMNIVNDKKEV
jgi:uronate dehydrogenase